MALVVVFLALVFDSNNSKGSEGRKMIKTIEFAGYVKKKFLDCPVSQEFIRLEGPRRLRQSYLARQRLSYDVRYYDDEGPYGRILHCYLPFQGRTLRASANVTRSIVSHPRAIIEIRRELQERVIKIAMEITAAQAIAFFNSQGPP